MLVGRGLLTPITHMSGICDTNFCLIKCILTQKAIAYAYRRFVLKTHSYLKTIQKVIAYAYRRLVLKTHSYLKTIQKAIAYAYRRLVLKTHSYLKTIQKAIAYAYRRLVLITHSHLKTRPMTWSTDKKRVLASQRHCIIIQRPKRRILCFFRL